MHVSLTNLHANRYSVKSVRSDSSTRLFAPKLSALCSNKQPHVLPSLLNLFLVSPPLTPALPTQFPKCNARLTSQPCSPLAKHIYACSQFCTNDHIDMQCPAHLAAMPLFCKTHLCVLTFCTNTRTIRSHNSSSHCIRMQLPARLAAMPLFCKTCISATSHFAPTLAQFAATILPRIAMPGSPRSHAALLQNIYLCDQYTT